MPSVIIPARNEEASIERTIEGVLRDEVEDLEVVVVVNGSTDRTAEIARTFEPRLRVVETEVPGKTNALNLGESTLKSFPRVFLDADIELQAGTLPAILASCDAKHPIVSPRPVHDLTGCGIGIRLFMRAERFNHYFGRGAPNGSGCFVLSESGRSRWDEFPDIVADDGYVANHFAPDEARTVEAATAVVRPARNLRAMTRVRARIRRGRYELERRFPELMGRHGSQVGGVIARMMARPWSWPALLVYGWVRVRERQLARRQIAAGDRSWGRDDTTRQSF